MKNLLSSLFKKKPETQSSNTGMVSDAPAEPTKAGAAAAFFTAIENSGALTHLYPTDDGKWSFVHTGKDFKPHKSVAPTAFGAVKATHHFVEGSCSDSVGSGVHLAQLLGAVEENKLSIMAVPDTEESFIYDWACSQRELVSKTGKWSELHTAMNEIISEILPDYGDVKRNDGDQYLHISTKGKFLVNVVAEHPAVSAARVGLVDVKN